MKMWMFFVAAVTTAMTVTLCDAQAFEPRIIRPSKSTLSNSNKFYNNDNNNNGYKGTFVSGSSLSNDQYQGDAYLSETESSLEQVDTISDKNFDAPPVATATTGGWPFISYALRGIAWLFVVGTLFLMFVGTVSAAFYRWTKAVASGRALEDEAAAAMADFVLKAVDRWNHGAIL